MVRLDEINENDVVQYWYDTGAFGWSFCYAKVLKKGAKRIKVKFENDVTAWRDPSFFDLKTDEKTVIELRADGVNI